MTSNRHSHRRTAASLVLLLAVAVAVTTTGCSAGIALAIIELTRSSGGGGNGKSSNQAPSVQVGSIERTDGMVQIPITPFDSDNTTVNINITYDIGGGPMGATISQTVLPADEFGSVETIVEWDAKTDFGGSIDYVGSIQLQITPDDGIDTGPAVFPSTFSFGNDAPVVTSCSVDTDEGEVSGITAVRFTITDSSSDLCDVTKIEFSEDGTFGDVINIPLDTGVDEDFPTGSLTALTSTGVEHSVSWDTTLTANINSTASKIRITIIDDPAGTTAQLTSASVESNSFAMANIDQNEPFASLQGIKRADEGGLRTGAIAIDYILFDPEKDPVDVRVEYSTDEKVTWVPCTEYPSFDSEGRYELASDDEDGIVHRFVWDAASDLFTYYDTVHVRVIPAALDGVGPPAETFIEISVGQDAYETPNTQSITGPCNGVVTGDINNDGITDAVVLNGGVSGSVTPMFADPDGTLARQTDAPCFGAPQQIVMGRFNADPYPDLAICTPATITPSNTVSIMINDMTGKFLAPVVYSVGDLLPRGIVTADFDDDNVLDLVITCGGSDTISFLKGNGDGTFVSPGTLSTVGDAPHGIARFDLDGDDFPDLAVCNEDDDSVSIMQNNQDGTFTELQTVSVGVGPHTIVAADFLLDGHPDLAVASTETAIDLILYDPDAGSFIPSEQRDITNAGRALVAGDFNDDGRNDALVVRETSDDLLFVLANPAGPAFPPTFVPYEGSLNNPYRAATADFNRDGQLDVIVVADVSVGNNVAVFYSSREGSAAPANSITLAANLDSVVAGDINRDGSPDLIMSFGADDTIEVLLGGGNGRFEFASNPSTSNGTAGAMALADFDNDGLMDVVVLDRTANTGRVMIGDGEGDFSQDTQFNTGSNGDEEAVALVAADFNNDGDVDLVVVNRAYDEIVFLEGKGDGSFEAAVATAITLGTEPADITIGDFNEDGVMDVAVVCYASDNLVVLTNDGLGAFTEAVATATATGPTACIAAHFDPDAYLDVAVACEGTVIGKVSIMRGNGDTTFGRDDVDGLQAPTDIDAGDANRDGFIDVILCGTGADRVGVIAATPGGGFRPITPTTVDSDPVSLAIADFDRDYVGDVATICQGSNTLNVLLGRRTRANWSRDLFNYSAGTGAGNVVGGSSTVDNSVDAFGDARTLAIGQRTFSGSGDDGADDDVAAASRRTNDFQLMAQFEFGASLPTMEALTRAWTITGDVRLHREEDETVGDTGTRIRPLFRFGTRVSPGDSTDLERTGLDVSDSLFSNQRGIIVDLPLRTSRTQSEVNSAVSGGKVLVIARYTDWRRADEESADPSAADGDAANLLPRIMFGDFRDVYRETYTWESVAWASPNNLLSDDQAGNRFVVDYNNQGNPRIRVLTDRFGVFQAFYVP